MPSVDDLGFHRLTVPALEALLEGDLVAASRLVGVDLPDFFLGEDWLWRIRLDQVRSTPGDHAWLVRAVELTAEHVVVGHAGFHAAPDAAGMVEVAYTVVPERRGEGLSHLMLAALVAEASASPDVTVVRATVAPDNLPSLAVVRSAGFVHVGEQWDDVDGTELIFEQVARRD